MAIVELPEKLDGFLAVDRRSGMSRPACSARSPATGRLQIIYWHGEEIVERRPVAPSRSRAPCTSAPSPARPGSTRCRPTRRPPTRLDADDAAQTVRSAGREPPNLADTSWVTNQYDRYVMGNTALSFPGRRRHDPRRRGRPASASPSRPTANGRYCQLDPYQGAQLALAEAYRNVAATGATPVGRLRLPQLRLAPRTPRSCGSSRRPSTGLADGCLELGVPVTGGNVSFYNQTGDAPILPTPVVGVLGVIDDVAHRIPSGWQDEGLNLYLLGIDPRPSSTARPGPASCTATSAACRRRSTSPPSRRPRGARLHAATEESLVSAAHDLSEGGLAQALAECAPAVRRRRARLAQRDRGARRGGRDCRPLQRVDGPRMLVARAARGRREVRAACARAAASPSCASA